MQPAKIGEVEKLLEGRIAGKSVAPLDWRASPLKIGNWRGLIEECAISSMSDPFAMMSPPPRVSADSTPSENEDLRELLTLMMSAIESDDEEPAVAVDKNRRRKVMHESDKRSFNDSVTPEENEGIIDWLHRFSVLVDVNRGPRAALFDGLRSYSGRFGNKRFSDLATGDRNLLATFVNKIIQQEAA